MVFLENAQLAEWILGLGVQMLFFSAGGFLLLFFIEKRGTEMHNKIAWGVVVALFSYPLLSCGTKILDISWYQWDLSSAPVESELQTHGSAFQKIVSHILGTHFSPYREKEIPQWVPWVNGFGVLWGLGGVVGPFWFFWARRGLKTFRKQCIPVTDARVLALFRKAKDKLHMPQQEIDFLQTPMTTVPFCMGVKKPAIVFSQQTLTHLSDHGLFLLLLHELSHVKHRDMLWGYVQRGILLFYWWIPFAYGITRSFSYARERLCDEKVLQKEQHGIDYYTKTLIDLVEEFHPLSKRLVNTAATSGFAQLKKRIFSLKYSKIGGKGLCREKKWPSAVAMSSLVPLFCLGVLLVGMTPTIDQTSRDSTENSPLILGRKWTDWLSDFSPSGIQRVFDIKKQIDSTTLISNSRARPIPPASSIE